MDKPKLKISLPAAVFFVVLPVFYGWGAVIPMTAAVLHEAGHLAVMLALGQKVKTITVLPFGIDIKKQHKLTSYRDDILIALAGVAVNFAFVLICKYLPKTNNVDLFYASNLLLMAVNLLPIKSLDGGVVTEKLLSIWWGAEKAESAIKMTSFVFILLLGSVAIWLLLYTSYNFSLLLMCIYLFAGIFLKK